MKELFPVDIVEYTTQSHLAKRYIKIKIIYIVIILVILLTFTLLPIIHVDVSSQSRGVIKTSLENNNLQSAIYGQIKKNDLLENKFVNKGDTLLWFVTDELDEQISRLLQKQMENSLFIRDIDGLLSSGNTIPHTPKYIAEYAHYRSKVSEQTITVKQQEREYILSKTLYEKGVEAQYEYGQAETKYYTAKSQLQLLKEQQLTTWQAERTRLELENRDLNSQLIRIEKQKEQYTIIAPITGTLVKCVGLQSGGFLSPGQEVAEITPDDNFIIECYVSPADIAYIKVGQPVSFQMDAFNYQQWGLLNGTVQEIISDVVEIDKQTFFRIRCISDRDYLELANGYKGYLKKGMTTTARFFLTRRSLSQLLFDKVDNWLNPKIMTNEN